RMGSPDVLAHKATGYVTANQESPFYSPKNVGVFTHRTHLDVQSVNRTSEIPASPACPETPKQTPKKIGHAHCFSEMWQTCVLIGAYVADAIAGLRMRGPVGSRAGYRSELTPSWSEK